MAKSEPFWDELTEELLSFDILDVPKTRKNRAELLRYIGKRTPQDRADTLRAVQQKWIGRRVVSGGVYGTVAYILPKGDGRVLFAHRDYLRTKGIESTSFSAAVLWDGQNQVRITDEVESLCLS